MDLDDEELEATRKIKFNSLYGQTRSMNNIEILELFIKSIRSDLHDDSEDNQETANAIENLIQENKELKEEISKYEKQLDLDYVEENYISKSKVKEKIEELKEKQNNSNKNIYGYGIYFLQELLEEGE